MLHVVLVPVFNMMPRLIAVPKVVTSTQVTDTEYEINGSSLIVIGVLLALINFAVINIAMSIIAGEEYIHFLIGGSVLTVLIVVYWTKITRWI
jgi:hypothetical protein